MSRVIRTPEERFEHLPDFPFAPNYVVLEDPEFGALRMHYLDEGPKNGPTVVMLHGQGCWCYIFRHMIPLLANAGHRVICPDFIGFGRSRPVPFHDMVSPDDDFADYLRGNIQALFINNSHFHVQARFSGRSQSLNHFIRPFQDMIRFRQDRDAHGCLGLAVQLNKFVPKHFDGLYQSGHHHR